MEISLADNYSTILNYFLDVCTHYSVAYPGGTDCFDSENPLMYKKDSFLRMSGIIISKWENMRDSISISGRLTSEAKQLFIDALRKKGLWNFSLYRDHKAVFAVSDFDFGLIDLPMSEIDELFEKQIISINDLFE